MKTKTITATAPTAVEIYNAAKDAHAAALSRHGAVRTAADRARGTSRMPAESRIEVCEAEAAMLEADDALQIARSRATAELATREVAEPDERAALAACDVPRLLADFVKLQADVASAENAYRAAVAARNTRVIEAFAAHDRLTGIRNEQELPPPVRIPSFLNEIDFAADLGAIVAAGGVIPPASNRADRICQLRAEETGLRAGLERERLDAIERDEDARARRANRDEEFQRRAKARAASNAAIDALNAADRAKIEALAAAHRSRSAS